MDTFKVSGRTYLRGQYAAAGIKPCACRQETCIAFGVTGNIMGGKDGAGDGRAAHVDPDQCIAAGTIYQLAKKGFY
jgi:hypothetical protein